MEKERLEELRRIAGLTEKEKADPEVDWGHANDDVDNLIHHAQELQTYILEAEPWKGPVGGKVIRCLKYLMGIAEDFGDMKAAKKIQAALQSIDLLS